MSTASDSAVDGEDDGTDAWGWGDDDVMADETPHESKKNGEIKERNQDEDDSAEAWGWGDEDTTQDQEFASSPVQKRQKLASTPATETRELILKEIYHISSMPDPVLELIYHILDDGAVLTRGEERYSHVASTASGLFSLPTFALALFRAISPHYYPVDEGSSM